jgi:hypothetical protein
LKISFGFRGAICGRIDIEYCESVLQEITVLLVSSTTERHAQIGLVRWYANERSVKFKQRA